MAKFSRLKVLTSMIEVGLIPVFYHAKPDVATEIVRACTAGGTRCFEFTNRGDRAHEVFRELAAQFASDERVILGAGSILDAPTAALYIQLGANFIVGPNLNPEVARLCNRHKVAYSPGCGSVSEISQAEELGVEICKVFPGGPVGGPGFIKDVLAPMPWTRLMPTGGVDATEESVARWINAGATCLGMGSKLFPKEMVESGNTAAITATVKSVVGWIQAARAGKVPIA